MATWEEQPAAQRTTRLATNWSLLVGLASVFLLSAGTLAATRLPAFLQALAPEEPAPVVTRAPLEAARTTTARSDRAQIQPTAPAVAPVRPRAPASAYVVVFGEFLERAEAETYARLVRSKGYIAGIIPTEVGFRVVSRPYASMDRAQFWASIFLEIGLDAERTGRLRDSGL